MLRASSAASMRASAGLILEIYDMVVSFQFSLAVVPAAEMSQAAQLRPS
jgi:hypothetical protein